MTNTTKAKSPAKTTQSAPQGQPEATAQATRPAPKPAPSSLPAGREREDWEALFPADEFVRLPNMGMAKLLVMKACPYLLKKTTKGLNYSYASEAATIALIRPQLLRFGITVAPVSCRVVKDEPFTTRSGAPMNRTTVHLTYRFEHVWSGESELVEMHGEGADVGDKSVNKAQTDALKYALRQWLLIETGDDPDRQSSELMARDPVFEKCKAALLKAQDRRTLDLYKAAYEKRPFSEEQLQALDLVFNARVKDLTQAQPPAGQPPK